ncbi:MAG: hypothetical protein M3Q65_01025, partial [Chloroflexota bacterium]|nr:hypothetical protein [Chloroflexota bacterium]
MRRERRAGDRNGDAATGLDADVDLGAGRDGGINTDFGVGAGVDTDHHPRSHHGAGRARRRDSPGAHGHRPRAAHA